jgi:hypothetical protein
MEEKCSGAEDIKKGPNASIEMDAEDWIENHSDRYEDNEPSGILGCTVSNKIVRKKSRSSKHDNSRKNVVSVRQGQNCYNRNCGW